MASKDTEPAGPGSRSTKAALFDAVAEVARALSAGRRLEIIDVLAQGERSVEDLARELDQSIANTSRHLRILAQVGLVDQRRDGTRVYYHLADRDIEELWDHLRAVAERHSSRVPPRIQAYLGPLDDVDVVGREELLARLRAGTVTLVDVRPRPEYEAGHIEGALSVPLTELEEAIASLPRDVEIVAYCRGPLCAFAPAAVRALRRAGLRAARLDVGFPAWRRSGLPVADESPASEDP